MLYVSVRWSRFVDENFKRSSGRMRRIVAMFVVLPGVKRCCHNLVVTIVGQFCFHIVLAGGTGSTNHIAQPPQTSEVVAELDEKMLDDGSEQIIVLS